MCGRPLLQQPRRTPTERCPRVAESEFTDPGLDSACERSHLLEHAPRLLDGANPSAGERDLTSGAVDESGAEVHLECRNGAGHRGLGHVEVRGRVGEAALVSDGDQRPQMAKLHIHVLSV